MTTTAAAATIAGEERRSALDPWVLAGLTFAVCVSPFIGGIRGLGTMLVWLILPLAWGYRRRGWRQLGLQTGASAGRWAAAVAVSAVAGIAVAGLFLWAGSAYPVLLEFIGVIPALHGEMVLSIPFFIAMIPVAHVVHELFYRGFLQSRLTAELGSAPAAILFGALLYAWTHVFIYASLEYQAGAHELYAGTATAPASVEVTLRAVTFFAFVESIGGGTAFHLTGNVFAAVAFRAANLMTLVLVVFPRVGLL